MQSGLFIFIFGVIPGAFSQLCKPPYLEFRNERNSYLRRIPYIIEIDVDRCPGLPLLYYKWSLVHAGNAVRDHTYRDFQIHGYEQVPGETAFTETTTLIVTVSHYENFSIYAEEELEIKFEPEPLHLEIVGGEKRIVPEGTELIFIDGISFSYDPSFTIDEETSIRNYHIEWTAVPPVDTSVLDNELPIQRGDLKKNVPYNFTMTVTRDEQRTKGAYYQGSVSQIIIIQDVVAIPGLKMSCVHNCENTNFEEVLVLEMSCIYNCEELPNKWFWSLDPDIPVYHKQFGTGYDKLIIDAYSYSPGSTVNVTAKNGVYTEYLFVSYIPIIKPGQCFIEPKEGVSAVTLFKITCEGFYSPLGIKKYFIHQEYDETTPGVMLYYGAQLEEKRVFLAPGSPAIILVTLEDDSFMEVTKTLEVEVTSPVVRLKDLKVIVLGRTAYSLYSCWKKNLRNEMAQTVSFVVEALRDIPGVSMQEMKNLYIHIVRYVSYLEPRDFGSIKQWMSLTVKILNLYNNTLDTFITRYVAENLEAQLNTLQIIVVHNLEDILRTDVQFFLQKNFQILTFIMQPMNEIKNYLNVHLPPHQYDTYDDMVHDRLEMRDNLRELTESCFRSFEIIQVITMHLAFVEEREMVYYSDVSAYLGRKIVPKNMPSFLSIRSFSNSRIHFPDNLINFLVKTYSTINYFFIAFSYDPFWWHSNITELSTDKFLCGIFHENEKITVVPAPFYVTLGMKENPISKIYGTVTDATFFNIDVHRIIVNPNAQLLAYFEATTISFRARFSDCYCDPEDMKNAKLIRADSFERERVMHYETKLDVAFLCVQRLDLTNELDYVGWINKFECMYWDLQYGHFQAELVRVSEFHLHPDDNLVCESFHFSLFLGKSMSPIHHFNKPEVIDFYIIFYKNIYVIIFVALLLCIWLILLYWAIFKDREFAKNNVVCKLDDNVPGDQHIYLVVVFTGVFIDAGTTADVSIQIIGDEAQSRVHLIKCCKMSLLKRNSQDWFIIYTPRYLGDLKTIRLWHNCRGSEPHWYCQRIIIEHLRSGIQYFFLVNEWLSLIWGSGKIFREVQVQHWMEMKRWSVLFAIKMEKIKDHNLWVSVIARESQSSFNCKERVSTAIAAIFISMLACAILFGYPHGVPSDSIDPQTKYYITLETIIIFTESWLISIPIIFLIILIFKNSAP